MDCNIRELIAQMTLEEKAGLCSGATFWETKAIPRLGIPSMFVSDGPHGLRKQAGNASDHLGLSGSVPAVCFPTAAGLASSWDRDLVYEVAQAIGEEAQTEQVAVVLGPGVNIKRTPLCGRNFEYFSEDPYLSGELGVHFVQGVQAKGVGTSLKHYAANNQETRRMGINALVDERTLMEIYLASFEPIVRRAQPWTVMCSYNRVNGEFACQNEFLLKTVLRERWGFEGFVVTDWGAMDKRVPSLKAGTELEMPASGPISDQNIVDAVKNGELDEQILDEAARRYLNILFRWEDCKQPGFVTDFEAHHRLARKAAADTMVLAKNEGVLPFAAGTFAVIGDIADRMIYQGGGSSHINSTNVERLPDELDKFGFAGVAYAQGYRLDGVTDDVLLAAAVKAAVSAKNVVVVVGQPESFLAEGTDRKHMQLPDNQNRLIEAVLEKRPDAAIVITCPSAIEMPWFDRARAVLIAYLGGQAAAGAIADLLTGRVSPSAKLAETWPVVVEHNPAHLNFPGNEQVEYHEGLYVGYRYYEKKKITPRLPFGYGLSYTTFAYSNLRADKAEMKEDETLTVQVDLENTGHVIGKEIVQLYVREIEPRVDRPVKELKGFEKVELAPGEKKTVSLKLDKRAFAFWDVDRQDWTVKSGEFELLVGSSSINTPLSTKVTVQSDYVPYKEFNLYTSMGEVLETPEGSAALLQLIGAFMQNLGGPAGSDPSSPLGGEMLGMDLGAMLKTMPMKTIITLSGGAYTEEQANQLLGMINQARKNRI